jgi:hypothetical protein
MVAIKNNLPENLAGFKMKNGGGNRGGVLDRIHRI